MSREENLSVIYDWHCAMDKVGRIGECEAMENKILAEGGYNADELGNLSDKGIEYLAQNLPFP